jgi:hypothetical protein
VDLRAARPWKTASVEFGRPGPACRSVPFDFDAQAVPAKQLDSTLGQQALPAKQFGSTLGQQAVPAKLGRLFDRYLVEPRKTALNLFAGQAEGTETG